jgi:para-aminobenzoate synthetase/4-amino-4-deoxychorismate lyase
LRCTDLGPGPSATELVRRVAGWDGLICLHGAWADGAAILTSHPVVVRPGGDDPVAALDDVQSVEGGARDLVGGGWFARLDFDGPSRLAYHDHVVRLVDGRWQFEALHTDSRADALAHRLRAWRAALAAPYASPGWQAGEFAGPPPAAHLAAVERAVELVRAGALYQVNVCTRFAADFAGDAAGLFADAVAALEPRYAAYISGPRIAVSLSPELFLRRRGREVMSAPIKGTLPRDVPGNEAALRGSAKDAAENMMIVDLVRNDLGRVCATGSVRAATLLEVQAHPGVWHLVSTVVGRLRADVSDADLLRATFPPGSVTGAPKLRALDAIGDLEPVPRGAYTGAIGFVSPIWGAEFNVAIRTFEIADGRIELGVGGGVTADSVPMLEWRECLHKATPLLAAARSRPAHLLRSPAVAPAADQFAGGLLETILALDGVPVRAADHLARLDRSCRELYGAGVPDDLGERVRQAAKAVPPGRGAVRVVVGPDLVPAIDAAPVAPHPVHEVCAVARPAGLWRHKWADRRWAADDAALFIARDGAVLETARGNVFMIEPDGTLVTPPLRDDLLPGVTRRALLDHARDTGRPTCVRAFNVAEMIGRPSFWTSSLSLAVPIHRVDRVELPRADALVAGFAGALSSGNPSVR